MCSKFLTFRIKKLKFGVLLRQDLDQVASDIWETKAASQIYLIKSLQGL